MAFLALSATLVPQTGLAVDQVNAVRHEIGVPFVERDEMLDVAATLRAVDMVDRGYFAHRDPQDGQLLFKTTLDEMGYPYAWAGEILCRADDADDCYESWLTSRGHREILLAPSARRYGLGTARGSDGREYAVALFAR